MKSRDTEQPTAVALQYDGQSAPRVTATGSGALAEQILEIARAHGIPLHQDANLVSLLACLELGEEIPQALYVAVAEVLAFAYFLTGKVPDNVTPRSD